MSASSLAERLAAGAPYVTAVAILLDDAALPSPDVVLDRLRLKFGITSTADFAARAGVAPAGREWVREVHVEDYPFPILVHAVEGALSLPNGTPFDAERHLWEPERVARLERHAALLEIETVLVPDQAQAAYGYLLKIAALAAGDDPVAFVDRDSARVLRPAELYDITQSAAPPAIADLYGVVASAAWKEPDPFVVLTTRGLRRAMLPELHQMPLPVPLVGLGADLLAAVAGQLVLLGLPEEDTPTGLLGTPVTFGWKPTGAVRELPFWSPVPDLHTWIVLLPSRGLGEAGELDDIMPSEIAEDLSEWGPALVEAYAACGLRSMTPFESHIRATRARERVPLLARAWHALAESDADDAELLIKVGFAPAAAPDAAAPPSDASPSDGAPTVVHPAPPPPDPSAPPASSSSSSSSPRPDPDPWQAHVAAVHCWFRVCDLADDAFLADPIAAAPGLPDLTPGDLAWYRRDQLTDWRLVVGATTFGPDDMLALRALLARLEA